MSQNAGALTNGGNNNGFDNGTGDGYTWSQNDEEVELRFPVAAGTKAKYVKVNFARTTLKVIVAGQTLANGELGGNADVEDSTYTIEDNDDGDDDDNMETCISATSSPQGSLWTLKPMVVMMLASGRWGPCPTSYTAPISRATSPM